MTPAITLEELSRLEPGVVRLLEGPPRSQPRPARAALRHRRRRQRAGVRPPHLGSGTALGPAHRRIARAGQRKKCPHGPLDALFGLHNQAVKIFRTLLDDPAQNWDETMTLDFPWLPPQARTVSRRKVLGHALFHSQRHWAQLATLVRAAGFPSEFKGDLLFSSALV